MKQPYQNYLLLFLFLMAGSKASAAYINGIYYNLRKDTKTADVWYKYSPYDRVYSNKNAYSGDVVIPSSVTYENVNYTVTCIGHSAFRACSELTSITIPSTITQIGDYAFDGCSGLNAVYISDLVAWNNINYAAYGTNPLYFAHHLFLNGIEIKNLVIPDGVTEIHDGVFLGCSGLTSVTIPSSVTTIGNSAFYGCSGLTSVTIPSSVTTIGNNAFFGCSGLTSVTIPNSVTSIGNNAFYGCI